MRTIPPYGAKREIPDRLRLMREMFSDRADWVLSGAIEGWGNSISPLFDFVVFVRVEAAVRVQRLRAREARRFGAGAIGPGGWRHEEAEKFFDWTSHYDDGSREGRSLARHSAWLATLACPVVELDGVRPTPELVDQVLAALALR